jgi:dGTPase
MMDWSRLLSCRRLRRPTNQPLTGRTEFERDRDRIVFSEAFRRLADKTQVHPFSDNDHIRTRLTHSIEVASVGRSLGAMVGKDIIQRHQLDAAPHDFATIVEAASLAHDIGNPPFGHSGESAISEWFRGQLGCHLLADLSEQERRDLQNFEGNAQGFRLLTRLQNHVDNGGLQLTHAVLGAFTKYPRSSDVNSKCTYVGHKKHGFFKLKKSILSRSPTISA